MGIERLCPTPSRWLRAVLQDWTPGLDLVIDHWKLPGHLPAAAEQPSQSVRRVLKDAHGGGIISRRH